MLLKMLEVTDDFYSGYAVDALDHEGYILPVASGGQQGAPRKAAEG